ncbi:MAG TPA: acetaldehyde dehydrogenase (acetylating) [Ruminiclostridium sp.]
MKRIKVAVLGSGSMGMDLMKKIISRSKYMELSLPIAKQSGIEISSKGIQTILENADIQIIFNTTNDTINIVKYPQLADKFIVNMMPNLDDPYIIPSVNLDKVLENKELRSVNLMTFGGQAAIPIVYAINKIQQVEYAEIVSTISSEVIDNDMRASTDEFIDLTSQAIVEIGGAKKGKTISLLNPALPPILMRDTIYVKAEKYDMDRILKSVYEMEKSMQEYVPGYKLLMEPMLDENKIIIMIQVEATGGLLPSYAGNIDIMTCAAMKTGDVYSKKLLNNTD